MMLSGGRTRARQRREWLGGSKYERSQGTGRRQEWKDTKRSISDSARTVMIQ